MPEPTQWPSPPPRTRAWGGRDDPARRLWGLWRQGQQPRVEEFLAQTGVADAGEVLAVLRVDQSERFRLGEWVRSEVYLEAFPAVRDNPELALDLIFAEYLLREEAGQRPTPEEYSGRFPRHVQELKLQLELHRAVETDPETATHWPGRGATAGGGRETRSGAGPEGLPEIPGYEVQCVLGRGGMGVVYRAWQEALNRAVALKMVTAGALADPQTLWRFRVEAEAVARVAAPEHCADPRRGPARRRPVPGAGAGGRPQPGGAGRRHAAARPLVRGAGGRAGAGRPRGPPAGGDSPRPDAS